MIVHTDFLDHWKTVFFNKAIGRPDAFGMILRLWGHCQIRKQGEFENMNAVKLACICKWDGDPDILMKAFTESSYAYFSGDTFVVHEWEEVNAKIVADYRNGCKGGRPRKEPNENPNETQSKGNDKAIETNKIRNDKKRKEKIDKTGEEYKEEDEEPIPF